MTCAVLGSFSLKMMTTVTDLAVRYNHRLLSSSSCHVAPRSHGASVLVSQLLPPSVIEYSSIHQLLLTYFSFVYGSHCPCALQTVFQRYISLLILKEQQKPFQGKHTMPHHRRRPGNMRHRPARSSAPGSVSLRQTIEARMPATPTESEAWQLRCHSHLELSTRVLEFCELSTMMCPCSGNLLPDTIIHSNKEPIVTQDRAYWGVQTTDDISFWMQHEMAFFVGEYQAHRLTEATCQEAASRGWHQSTAMLLDACNTILTSGLATPSNF